MYSNSNLKERNMIKEAILKAASRENLSYDCAEAVMHEIMAQFTAQFTA
jgi:hypothetical protein